MEIFQQHPNIKKIIEDVAKKQKFKNYEITDIKTNPKGEGFMGQIFMVTIEDPSKKKLNFVIKAAFNEETIRKVAPIRNSFLNEILIYTKLETELRTLACESKKEPFQFFPKCYKAFSEEKQEFLCLENLKASNFEVFNKKEILDDEHVSFIFKIYGRFHGYSYALKDRKPEVYKGIVDNLCNIFDELVTNPNGNFTPYMKSFEKIFEKCFEPGKDDEIKKKYQKYCGDGIIDEYSKIANEKCNFSTILHGDCWSNNMMFKYEVQENKKKLIDMRFLDLQLSKEGSPVCDLSYCLYAGASKPVFDNLEKYLKIYHDSLSLCLKEFGCDPEKLLPYDALINHWKKYSRFGMLLAFAVIRINCINQENAKDYTDVGNGEEGEDVFGNQEFDEEIFKKRAMELLYHMSEINAL